MKGKRITASELVARLGADTGYLAKEVQRTRAMQERHVEYQLAEAPIINDLREAGVEANSVWDLVNWKKPVPLAIPVLHKHLGLDHPPQVREGIARAMSEPAARPFWSSLVNLYRKEADARVKDAIAIALCGAAGADEYDELISLSLDPINGPSRVVLIWALERRIPASQAEPVLVALANDPETKLQAEATLKWVRAKLARKKS
jgi:hypothetical protein